MLYPVLGYAAGHAYPAAPTFGLPCPTTIFTFAVLLWADRAPRHLLIIPLLWSIVGGAGAFAFGVVEDAALPLTGIAATALILQRLRAPRAAHPAIAPVR